MMPKEELDIIGVICYKLPFELSNQIYNEYQSRFKEAFYLIDNFSFYKRLEKDIKVVRVILALSIFHKRFISNLDAASKFYKRVTDSSPASTISIGSYDLTSEENKKIYATLMSYRDLCIRFSLNSDLFEYYETKELLSKIIKFKRSFGKHNQDETPSGEETDIPF